MQTKHPVATQMLLCDSPWQPAYSCDDRKIQPLFGFLCGDMDRQTYIRSHSHLQTLFKPAFYFCHDGFKCLRYSSVSQDQHSRQAGSLYDHGWQESPQLI